MDIARNNLGSETSPYLRQHADNPVHWQPWSTEVLAAAKAATSRSFCLWAMRRATGAMSWPMKASKTMRWPG